MERGGWSVVAILVACLLLVGAAAEEHDPGSVAGRHHAVAP
ncbi:MAG: hypothetical protein ABIQ59_10730 [Nocardioidaceae bacterium]